MKNLQKLLLAFAILLTICSFVFGDHCGIDRRDVKSLLDKEAAKIKWTPKNHTVKYLSKLIQVPFPAKDKKFNKKIRYGNEFNVYEIKCRIREFRKEDDGDYHLVLVDLNDTTITIVGEIIDPNCPDLSGSQYMGAFKNIREEFELFKLPKNKVMEGVYTITGVCFYDKLHGQLGISANGIELHPIMDIQTDFK